MSDCKSKGKGKTRWTREFKLRARCPICTNASALPGAYVNDVIPAFRGFSSISVQADGLHRVQITVNVY
jgi:hypothetical protein